MVGVAYIIGGQGVYFTSYRIGECGMRRHWKLFVTITSLLQSMEGTCHGQVCILVPGAVSACCTCRMCCYMCVYCGACCAPGVAALGICVATCMCCGAWSAPGAVSACCIWHMCWLCVCVVVLGAHLVLSVLAALSICVSEGIGIILFKSNIRVSNILRSGGGETYQ